MLDSNGERIKPSRYDGSLDNPSNGVIQGLVFFPKQNNKDYVIGIKGMDKNERIFSFAPPENPVNEPKKNDVVVVNVPKRQPKKQTPVVINKKPQTPPPPPMIPKKPIPPIFQETSSDIAEFVKSIHDRDNKKDNVSQDKVPVNNIRPSNIDNSYVSKESVLKKFLSLWAENNTYEMYNMLSEQSKKNISLENFSKAAGKDAAFRQGLKSDYRIDWIGEQRAKVITTHKTLVFKSVVTRTLGIIREGSSWRVVW